jgi:hypothetical protein
MRRQVEAFKATWIKEAELARSIPGVSFSELRNVVAKAEALEAGEEDTSAAADRERQQLLDRKAAVELRKKHKRLKLIWHESGLVAVRCPDRGEYEIWKQTQAQEADAAGRRDVTTEKLAAAENLGRQCVAHPAKTDYDARVLEYTGLADLVLVEAVKLAEGKVKRLGK